MIKSLSLRKNFSWNLLANLIFAVTQWGILSIIAKLGTTEMVGQFALGLALTAPLVLLMNLQLRAVQATDANEKYDLGNYFGLRIVTNFFTLLIVVLILLIGKYDITTKYIIILIALSKIIDGFSDILYGYFQRKERMDISSKSKIFKGIITLIIFFIIMKLTNNLVTSLIGMCTSYLFTFLIYDLYILRGYRKLNTSFESYKLKELVILAFPLGVVLMMSSLYVNIPRIFIEKFSGLESLGYFSAIAYILTVGSTFINAVGQAISPRLATYYANKEFQAYKKLLKKSVFIGAIMGLIIFLTALLFGKSILTLLYSEEYAKYNYLFIVLSLSTIISFMASFLGYGITAIRSFKIQPYLALTWTISSLIAAYFLIPRYELTGAVSTIAFAALVQFVVQLTYLWLKFKNLRIS